MKSSYLLILFFVIAMALGLGWFLDKTPTRITSDELQVPDNIDYYLSNLKYQSMNPQGTLHYEIKSPYLEHYIKQNISRISQPVMMLFGNQSDWEIQAEKGTLHHQLEQFELQNQVILIRASSDRPLHLTTDRMILQASKNLIDIPQAMQVTSNQLQLLANTAILNIDLNRFRFSGVKAIYQPVNFNRPSNERS